MSEEQSKDGAASPGAPMPSPEAGALRKGLKGRPGSKVVAERYAQATLGVALDKNRELPRLGKELEGFRALLERETRLAAALADPTIEMAKRVAVLDDVVRTADLLPETRNLLRLLTVNERIPLLAEVSESYQRLVLEHQQVQPGEVLSAQPLTEDQQKRLAESLGKALGRTMELSFRSDPDLLGGVVVRIGNRVFDASVTTQLRRFKEKALSSL